MSLLRWVYLIAAMGAVVSFALFWSQSNSGGTVLSGSIDAVYNEAGRASLIYVSHDSQPTQCG